MAEVDRQAEDKILSELQRGSRRVALERLMKLYGKDVHAQCRAAFPKDAVEADDAYQTIFIQAHEALPTFAGRSSLRAWLFGITHHRCLDAHRSRRRGHNRFVHAAVEDAPDQSASAEQLIDEERRRSFTLECLDQLPREVRIVVGMRCLQELSYDAIASITGDKLSALQMRMSRALKNLRACIEGKEAGTPARPGVAAPGKTDLAPEGTAER